MTLKAKFTKKVDSGSGIVTSKRIAKNSRCSRREARDTLHFGLDMGILEEVGSKRKRSK